MTSLKSVAVYPHPTDPRIHRLLQSLSAAFNLRFCPIDSLDQLGQEAVLLIADDDAVLLKELSSFSAVFSAPARSGEPGGISGAVLFSSTDALDPALRGQTLACSLQALASPPELSGFETLASLAGSPVWAMRRGTGSRLQYRVNLPIRGLEDGVEIIDVLHEAEFISLLPLVEFLRRIGENGSWARPALRATLILDDPNLHYRRYGHIDYKRFADHARQTGFHACMATVPFDGWLINQEAAAIFQEYPDALSLAIHGNDHEYKELIRSVSNDEAAKVIAQAMRRIARIERKSGLGVAQIMVPPHGACSAMFFNIMARSGFYGATTTRNAVWKYSELKEREPGSGLALAEIVGGLPVIHRFRFNSDRRRHRIAITAYLKHPLIAYGHHEDFAGGLDAFDDVAKQINKFGTKWMSPTELFASNFESKHEGGTLWIKPFSRHVVVPAGNGCSEVRFDFSNFPDGSAGTLEFSRDGSPKIRHICANGTAVIATDGAHAITITLESDNQIAYWNVPKRRTRLTSAIRRVMSECRDRWT